MRHQHDGKLGESDNSHVQTQCVLEGIYEHKHLQSN